MTFFDIPSGQAPQPTPNPYPTPVDPALEDGTRSNWDGDEWEDEQVVTPIEDTEQLLLNESSSHTTKQPKKSLAGRIHLSASSSVQRPKRLKSRGRQKAQNARAGIKVITDFSAFRKPTQQQPRKSPNVSKPKFVDLAALRALEGSPNSASTGNWNWLKRQKSGASPNHLAPSPADVGLSPADRPIVIGISMDQAALNGREISPQTAVVATPAGLPPIQTTALSPLSTAGSATPATPSRLRSVWSPDTPGSANTAELETRRATSRIYSLYHQMTGSPITGGDKNNVGVPPVPEVPAGFKDQAAKPTGAATQEEVDTGTPCTLFEEDDGTPTPRKSRQGRQRSLSHAAHSRSVLSDSIAGWWDGESSAETPTPTGTAAVPSPRPQMRDLTIAQTPKNTPAVSSPRPHQREHTGILISTTTTVVVSSPRPQRDLTGGAAVTPKASEEPRPRILSTISDAVTEFDEEPLVQTATATAVVPSHRTHQMEATRGPAAVQQTIREEPEPSSRATPVPAPRFPPRSNSLVPAQWTSSPARTASPARTESPGRSLAPARGQSPGLNQSTERNQSRGPNQSTARTESPGRALAPARGQSPGLNRSTGRNQSPGLNRSTGRNQSPGLNQSTGRNQSPGVNQSTGRNESPGRTAPRLPLGAVTMSSSDGASSRRVENSRSDNTRVLAVENAASSEVPPPYSPPRRNLEAPVRFRPVFPPDHPLHGRFPPSPGPVSPAMARTMASQGAVNMTEIPLTPGPQSTTFRDRPAGGFVPAEEFAPVESRQDRVERRRLEEERKREEKERKREEKERKREEKSGGAGGILKMGWRLRNLFPRNKSAAPAAAAAPVGPPKKPIWPWVAGAGVVALIILAAVLATLLTRKGDSKPTPDDSRWVNVPGFPPMPTGILTVVGPDNSASVNQCTAPSTLWSCELPKELHDSVSPYDPNQPTVVMQIQFDNTTQASWDIPNGKPPVPTPVADDAKFRRSSTLGRRLGKRLARGISPDPSPPSFEDMFFLGNTTDGIVSDDKAGEPTPFYISLLQSVNDSVGPNSIDKRADSLVARQISKDLPKPELNEDGTGAPARLLPLARQQPVRLYDKGLPTEHYGFYTYFPRTIYLRSISSNNTNEVALDEFGGAREDEAKFLVTWSETRFLVRLWTNSDGTKSLLSKGQGGGIEDGAEMTRPGTMPYPVTMKLDTHGGDAKKKFVWSLGVDDRRVDVQDVKLLANAIGEGGEVVNPRSDRNPSFGGVDGGEGGCRCEWVNFAEKRTG